MKIQLITAVAAQWSCREKRHSPLAFLLHLIPLPKLAWRNRCDEWHAVSWLGGLLRLIPNGFGKAVAFTPRRIGRIDVRTRVRLNEFDIARRHWYLNCFAPVPLLANATPQFLKES